MSLHRDLDFTGRRVLVTGAANGFGAAIARLFHAHGAGLVLADIEADALSAFAAGLGAEAVAYDQADPASVEALAARAGAVDVLVNNAGIDEVGPLVTKTADDVARITQVNLVAPMELCRQAAVRMTGRGRGHLVNVSSMAGSSAFPGMSLYAASKAGLSHFSRVVARELAGTGVGVTLVELGPIPTDMLAHVNEVASVRAGFQRAYRLRLLVDVPREQVAAAVADAVERDRFNVILPRRAAAFPLLGGLPQRVVEVLSTGLPTR